MATTSSAGRYWREHYFDVNHVARERKIGRGVKEAHKYKKKD